MSQAEAVSIKRRILSAVLAIVLLFSLISCNTKGEKSLSKEEISARANSEEQEVYAYSLDYFEAWGIPVAEKYEQKVITAQYVYHKFYYKSEELPSSLVWARAAVSIFLDEYYDVIDLSDPAEVADAVIGSLVDAVGDRYSYYRNPEETEGYEDDMSGSFVGIGVSITEEDGGGAIFVTGLISGGGAEEAGILPGDKIVAVDGESVESLGYQNSINKVRGKEGTRVKLTVLRGEESLNFDIERRRVTEESVTYEIDENKIGYVRISSFKANTASQFCDAIDALEAAEVRGVVYDLRSNGGGYLSAVVSMLSYIAPKGTEIVSFSNDYSSPMFASNEHTFLVPSVVICNEYTASAGELFTAGIRDFSKMGLLDASIVGKTTFGKGILQTQKAFTDGSTITLTACYYNPPSRENYHGVGITPDIIAEYSRDNDGQYNAAMEKISELTK